MCLQIVDFRWHIRRVQMIGLNVCSYIMTVPILSEKFCSENKQKKRQDRNNKRKLPSVCFTSGFEDRSNMKNNISSLGVPYKKRPQDRWWCTKKYVGPLKDRVINSSDTPPDSPAIGTPASCGQRNECWETGCKKTSNSSWIFATYFVVVVLCFFNEVLILTLSNYSL